MVVSKQAIILNLSPTLFPTYVIKNVGSKVGDKKPLSPRRKQILREIRNNPNITQTQLTSAIGVGLTAIENNIRFLRENGYIERIGTNKTGYWKIK